MADSKAVLQLAPVGAGKTETAIQRLVALMESQPFASAWVLLASERQIHSFRQRMVAVKPGRHVFFNANFFNFYSLYETLLDAAGKPQRCLDTASRSGLLRRLLAAMNQAGELTVFSAIAETPGFARVMAEFIYELKRNLIQPEAFEAAAHTPKDVDLARIYRRYQSQLKENNLVDREGEGWLALDEVREQPVLGAAVDLLIVDGYDQFTPLQAGLLALLASRARETLITLTHVPGREQTIGRRFERARMRLHDAFASEGVSLVENFIAYDEDRHPALRHLVQNIFLRESVPLTGSEAVSFIEAPDVTSEVRAMLRRVKKLLLDGVSPDDIVIALRNWSGYAPLVAALAAEYDLLPHLALQYSDALKDNPAALALFNLLELAANDFQRRALLDTLRSPYFAVPGLDAARADQLDRVSQRLRLGGGRDEWLAGLEHAPNVHIDIEDDTSPPLLSPEDAAYLQTRLSEFFTRVTPPETSSISGYVAWLENLIGDDPLHHPDNEPDENPPPDASGYTLDMIGCIRRENSAALPLPAGVVERDLAALDALKRMLRSMLSTEALYRALGGAGEIDWKTWLTDLKNAVAGEVIERQPNRSGRVLVTTATDARGLPHPHVFILSLAEGAFPLRRAEDQLYLDSERRAFAARGIPLQTGAERADDDGLFYELICLARKSLTLSRPYIQDGDPWAESHLWRGALALFKEPALQRIPIGAVVDTPANLSEAALALADRLNHADTSPQTLRLHRWLTSEHSGYWTRITSGRQIENGRLSPAAHDRYSGMIAQPDLIAHIERKLGSERVWSASQLNDYGLCGFRFFAGRLLGLAALKDPEVGMDNLQLGSLYHEILEETYRRLANKPISPENTDAALALLRQVAAEKLPTAPQRLGFRESALWTQEQQTIRQRLERLVRLDFSGSSPLDKKFGGGRRVQQVEMPFGMRGEQPFRLDLGDEEWLRVRGKIDRIDRTDHHVVIIDYKTGSSSIDADELAEGRNFQMMIYLLAARALLGDAVIGGAFWHIGSPEKIEELRFDTHADAIEQARRHLSRNLTQARRGDFTVEPNRLDDGRCIRYCDFQYLCRVSIMNRHKGKSVVPPHETD